MSQPSPDSEQQLFDEYSTRLIRLASAHIHPKLQQRFDGEDLEIPLIAIRAIAFAATGNVAVRHQQVQQERRAGSHV